MTYFKREKLFLFIVFVFGGIFLLSYGAHLDQRSEQEILFYNVRAYCEQLGYKGNIYQSIVKDDLISIRDSIEKDHGMSVYYPVFWIYYVNHFSGFIANLIWHTYIYLFFFWGVICLYRLLRETLGIETSIITTLLLIFTPRIFAEMHYNNKDIVVLALVMIIYDRGYRLLRETTYKNAVLFGIMGAVVANMKIIGLFIWGFVGLYIAIYKLLSPEKEKRLYSKMALSVMTSFFILYLLTPAMWGDVIGYFKYVMDSANNFRWYGSILYNGKIIDRLYMQFPRKYIPTMIALTVPIGILIMAVIGGLYLLKKVVKKQFDSKKAYLLITVLGGIIPLLYAIVKNTPVYNGWRHVYFVYASIIVLVSMGVFCIVKHIQRKKYVYMGFGVYISFLVIGIIVNHPYQYAYYNLLAGKNVEARYELDYWDMSVKQALDKILREDSGECIAISFCDNYVKWGIERNREILPKKDANRLVLKESMSEAQYVIVNRTYSEIYSKEQYLLLKEQYENICTLRAYGNVICEVYKKR